MMTAQAPSRLDVLIREPLEVYQAKAKDCLTSHQLADFRDSPYLFRKKQLGLVSDEDRPAFQIGRAAHTLILEGRKAYQHRYAIGGPVNRTTGEVYGPRTKAWHEWAERQAKPVLSNSQAALVEALHAAVQAHPLARGLLSEGTPEGVVRCAYVW